MSISRFIADLESRFDQGRRDVQRLDVHELVVEERASITLAQRLLATQGADIELLIRGGSRVSGRVLEVALTWVLIQTDREEVLIPLDSIIEASPLGRAAPEGKRVSVKLSMSSIVRRLCEQRVGVIIEHEAGQVRGTIASVYADHLDMISEDNRYGDIRDSSCAQLVSLALARVCKISVVANQW